jgi:hypothetical protein
MQSAQQGEMMRLVAILTAALALAGFGGVSAARADVASDMTAQLSAAGVPNGNVTVAVPAAASQQDADAFQQDPTGDYATVSDANLISPDPTNPSALATATFGLSSVTRLPGFIQPPGLSGYLAVEDASLPIWRLDIMSALKHAMASGATLAGVAMQPQMPNSADPATPDLYMAAPDAATFAPAALPQTMSLATIQSSVTAALPAHTQGASVTAVDFAGGQRRVTVDVSRPAQQFVANGPQDVVSAVTDQQRSLNDSGANIGSVIVRFNDPVSVAPLFTYAGDATWGQDFSWISPFVKAFVQDDAAPIPVDPASNAAGAVQDAQSSLLQPDG